MKDPYEVLGVPRNASEKEIKAAYKALVKKYHPDQYQDNPLAEFAEEKMAEINTAYDQIINERRGGGSYSSYDGEQQGTYSYGGSGSYTYAGTDYIAIRRMISSGNVTEAEQRLDAVPPAQRSAEWNFLKGNIAYARGWLNDAFNYFGEAARLDPYNNEYSAAYNRLNQQRGGYMAGNPTRSAPQNNVDSTLDCLSTLCIADCCCECMGGDLVPCC